MRCGARTRRGAPARLPAAGLPCTFKTMRLPHGRPILFCVAWFLLLLPPSAQYRSQECSLGQRGLLVRTPRRGSPRPAAWLRHGFWESPEQQGAHGLHRKSSCCRHSLEDISTRNSAPAETEAALVSIATEAASFGEVKTVMRSPETSAANPSTHGQKERRRLRGS